MSTRLLPLVFALFLLFTPSVQAASFTMLQLGWYTGVGISDMTRLTTDQVSGQTLQVAYYDPNPADMQSYLDALNANGLQTMPQINVSWLKPLDVASIQTFVQTWMSNTAIGGWYLADEPNYNGISQATLQAAYNAIKAVDPSHPISIAYYGKCSTVHYGSMVADIVLMDDYPVTSGAEYSGMSEWAAAVDDCQSFLGSHAGPNYQGLMPIVQAYNQGYANDRDPTYGEQRYMSYRAFLKQSVIGIEYWVDYRADAAVTANVDRLTTEARGIDAVLQSGTENDPAVSVSRNDIHVKRSGNTLLAIADGKTTQTVTFTLPYSGAATSVTLYDDRWTGTGYTARSVPLTVANGTATFSDTFTSHEVHVYQIGP